MAKPNEPATPDALRREVFACDACAGLGFGFERAGRGLPLFKFPPTIGAPGKAPILFVGLNPRYSESNAPLHAAIVNDYRAFSALAANRVRHHRYIERGATERHYAPHSSIVEAVFPGRAFEEVAAVTELFFCATGGGRALPASTSPCAERYFHRVVAQVTPRVVVAVGSTVEGRLRPSWERGSTFRVELGGVDVLVVPIAHPAAWVAGKAERLAWAAEVVRAELGGLPLPAWRPAPAQGDADDDEEPEPPVRLRHGVLPPIPVAPLSRRSLVTRIADLIVDIADAFARLFEP